MPKLKFAAIQINNCDTKSIEERDANLLHAQKIIDEIEAVDLIVLPELSQVDIPGKHSSN